MDPITALFLLILPILTASLPLPHLTLLSLKSSLTDPDSSLHDWNDYNYSRNQSNAFPWCSWSGVECNFTTGEVTALDLSSRNLSGYIPSEIRLLRSSLSYLNLSGNSFGGPFPVVVFDLRRLRKLDISHNYFNSTFPPGVGRLRRLEFFNAYSNNFSGPLPRGLSKVNLLRHLNLGGSFFSGGIPGSFGSLRNLRFLHLAGNSLSGRLPPELGVLKELEHLEIGYNAFSGGVPEEWGNLRNLVYIDVSNANLSGPLLPELGRLRKLESLFMFCNALAGNIPESYGELRSLRVLDLSNNALSGSIPRNFSALQNLTWLGLMNNGISGEIPTGIGELPELEYLLLWNNSLTGELPAKLGESGKLVKLDVSTNSLFGPIPTGLCSKNRLVHLILFCNRFESELPPSLTRCRSLWRIRIQYNRLNGSIPPGFGLLPNLTFLDLSSNNFSGNIPGDLGNASRLHLVNFSGNPLGSVLPDTIWMAPSLEIFSASNCRLHGEIPAFRFGCASLYKVEIAGNELVGSIPWDIGKCEKLLSLDLSRNRLSGIMPWELAALPEITTVDLSRNGLSGTIPSSFDNCTTLESFNVSFNLLTGEIPSSGLILRSIHPSSFAGNVGLCGAPIRKPCPTGGGSEFSFDSDPPRKSAGTAMVWVGAAAFAVGVFVLIVGTRFFNRRQFEELEAEVGVWKLTAFHRLSFTAEDVVECMAASDDIIGMGSTGAVYRAEMPGGETIAVKKLWGTQKDATASMLAIARKRAKRRGDSVTLAEVEVLGSVRHRNIVRLLGCCSNLETTLLLYDYMPNGSLEDLLHRQVHNSKDGSGGDAMSSWMTRCKIAVGIAEGLCYLHHDCDPVIVHRDLKPSNILLDGEMEARVADFGVAKLIQTNESMSVIAGSYGYIAPEYAYTLQVDEKSDIYSFGVVLMEMMSGRRAVEGEFGEGNSIVEWVKGKAKAWEWEDVLDKRVVGVESEVVKEEMLLVLRVALLCTGKSPADRPSMRDVVSMLREAKPKRKVEDLVLLKK